MGVGEVVWSVVTAVCLGAWLCASIVHQLRPRWWFRVCRYDILGLIPRWTFFAPNPGREDLHVVYRDVWADSAGPWVQLGGSMSSTSIRWLWNPDRYVRKAVHDTANGIIASRAAHRDTPRAVLLSASYLTLLNWITHQPKSGGDDTGRQFALIATRGSGEQRSMRVHFVSEIHPMP